MSDDSWRRGVRFEFEAGVQERDAMTPGVRVGGPAQASADRQSASDIPPAPADAELDADAAEDDEPTRSRRAQLAARRGGAPL